MVPTLTVVIFRPVRPSVRSTDRPAGRGLGGYRIGQHGGGPPRVRRLPPRRQGARFDKRTSIEIFVEFDMLSAQLIIRGQGRIRIRLRQRLAVAGCDPKSCPSDGRFTSGILLSQDTGSLSRCQSDSGSDWRYLRLRPLVGRQSRGCRREAAFRFAAVVIPKDRRTSSLVNVRGGGERPSIVFQNSASPASNISSRSSSLDPDHQCGGPARRVIRTRWCCDSATQALRVVFASFRPISFIKCPLLFCVLVCGERLEC